MPPSGVTIKCPKCQHVFVAKRDDKQQVVTRSASTAVPLPGTAAPGSRSAPVPLPGSKPPGPKVEPPPPAATAPKPSVNLGADLSLDDDLDLGLDAATEAGMNRAAAAPIPLAPSTASKKVAPPPRPQAPPRPAPEATPAPKSNAGDALDFIDDAADSGRAPAPRAAAVEFNVRRKSGRVEGPYGMARLTTMLRNGQLQGDEDISEGGERWRPMRTHAELKAVIDSLAPAPESDPLSFGNVDLGGDDGPPIDSPRQAPSRPAAKPAAGRSHEDLELGMDEDPPPPKGNRAAPSSASPASSSSSPPPASVVEEQARQATFSLDGSSPEDFNPDDPALPDPSALEVGPIPELPPIWKTYKLPILGFAGFVTMFLIGFFTHLWTPCGPFGTKCAVDKIASLFEPPPPPPPEAPPPPPPKRVDPKEVAALIDEGSFEAFRSVFATAEGGGIAPDMVLFAAKARGFATLAFGNEVFPIEPATQAIEAANALDLSTAMGGNTAAASAEREKARAAIRIATGAQEQAAVDLAQLLEQRAGDKEIAYLLGLARARLGDTQGALAALDKAIVADPNYAPALHAIGDVVASSGSKDQAAEWYAKALRAQPTHTRSAVVGAELYKSLNRFGARRRLLVAAAPGAERGLPLEQRAPFHYGVALAFEQAGVLGKAVESAQQAARLDPANRKYVALAAAALAEADRPTDALTLIEPVLAADPNDVDALLARARAQVRIEDLFTKAFTDLETARKVAPRDARPLLLEAEFNERLGKLADARDALGRGMLLDTSSARAVVQAGRLEASVGDVNAAFNYATQAVEKDPTGAEGFALLGDCYQLRDELEKAIEAYEKALQLDDELFAARLGYANALRDSGAKNSKHEERIAESLPKYLSLLQETPNNPTVMFEYGRALELQKDTKAAVELYSEAAKLDEKDPRPHVKMAAAYIEREPTDLPAAEKSLGIAKRIEAGSGKKNAALSFWEARLALLQGRNHDAQQAMQIAVDLEPRNAIYHYWLGRALEVNSSLYEAVNSYERAVQLNSRLAMAHRALGRTSLERNQFEKARESFEKYREVAPEDATIWLDIGDSYTRQNSEDQAMEAYQRAVKGRPDNGRALLAIGNILFNKGKEKDASKYFELAAKADPAYGDAWCQYGVSLARVKVTKDAQKALQRCLSLENSAEDLRANAKDLLETAGVRTN